MPLRRAQVLPGFIKIGSDIQKLIRGNQRQHGYLVSLPLFFQNKGSGSRYSKMVIRVLLELGIESN
jgi:hypothetical protein